MMKAHDPRIHCASTAPLRCRHRKRPPAPFRRNPARPLQRDLQWAGDSPEKHQRLFVVTVPPVRRKWGKKLMASLSAAGFIREDSGNAQWRTPQEAGHGRKTVRAIEPPGRGPEFRHRRFRRRRRRRRHRPAGLTLHARPRPGANSHHRARASGRLHRRQNRGQPARWKKSGRHLPSSPHGPDRSRRPHHAARPRIPRRPL